MTPGRSGTAREAPSSGAQLAARSNLVALLERHHITPKVAERILRLNPNWKPTDRIRGMHRRPSARMLLCMSDLVGKKDWLAMGRSREDWDAIPNGFKAKFGRRKYVTRWAVLDNIHLMYRPGYPRHVTRFVNRRYANDPRGVEILDA